MSDAESKRFSAAGLPPEGLPQQCVELCPICRGAEVLRASPELRDGWQSLQREALVTMRALIDHYLERLDAAESAPSSPRVVDIPIE